MKLTNIEAGWRPRDERKNGMLGITIFTPNPLMMVMVMEMKLVASHIGSIYPLVLK